jgi:carbonic anhydrase
MSITAPININNNGAQGNCDSKCDYAFEYKSSNCTITNNGVHIKLSYDMSSTAPVRYNSDNYQVNEVLLYFPSIHKYNNSKADGELIVVHSSGGRKLIVSVPIIVGSTKSGPSEFLKALATNLAKFAPKSGNKTQLSGASWNLSEWIPTKKYYSYTATGPHSSYGSGTFDYVVFNRDNGASVSITSSDLNKIKEYISASEISIIEDNPPPYFISKNNAVVGLDKESDDIYISCSPTSVSQEHELVGENGELNYRPQDRVKSGNSVDKLKRFMKITDFFNNPIVTIIMSSLVMVGVYKVGIAVFKRKPKTS